MKDRAIWLALGYNIPVNPSKNRVYIWRKLKEFGAEYFKQGVAVLPQIPENLDNLRELSFKIREMGGDASIVEMKFIDENDEFDMVCRFKNQSETSYKEIMDEIHAMERDGAISKDEAQATYDDMKRVIKKYNKTRARDYFPSSMATDIEDGLTQIIDTFKDTASDFGSQLRKTLNKYK